MRISDLSRSSGVPIPTVKFYLREGLLHPGERTAPNHASYDASHVRRLQLVRVLADVGGLSVAAIRSVLSALEQPELPLHDALAAAHTALPRAGTVADERRVAARRETDAWLDERGWRLDPATPARDELAAALAALRQLGWEVGPEVFERYARAADTIAAEEIAYVAAAPDREAAVEATVVGTVVFERALVALRRLAEEHHSRTRFTD